jgi:dynein heavy chain
MVHREINDLFILLVKHFPRKKKFDVFRCFVDDMNMPEMDKYYTVQAHTILRQYLDYKHWYDRQKLTLRDIHNCQYVACMNPTAGNFTIDSRIQRHFAVFAVSFPGQV